ncbi:MAG TPA: ankyrin repeat domain-containing protein [Candidatus Bathyarchaeia archaeon]|nr:ankyrin repeat domain-containing protein [Candidatus Bathyarchaeia archaeon]
MKYLGSVVCIIFTFSCFAAEKKLPVKLSDASFQWLSKQQKESNDTSLHKLARNGKNKTGHDRVCEKFANCEDSQKKKLLKIENRQRRTPVGCAIINNKPDIFKIFMPYCSLAISHLWLAIKYNAPVIFDTCLEQKQVQDALDFPDADDSNNTALHKAVFMESKSREHFVAKLLAHKKELAFLSNKNGYTPYDSVVERKDVPILVHFTQVLKNFLDISTFLKIIQGGKSATVKEYMAYMKENIAQDVFAQRCKETLLVAVKMASFEIVKLITEVSSPDFSAQNEKKETILDTMLSQQFTEERNKIIELFIDMKMPMTGDQLLTWASKGYYAHKPLPYPKSILNARSKDGNTPLGLAAKHEHYETTESLLASDVNLFIRNDNWKLPGMSAWDGDKKIAKNIHDIILFYQETICKLYKKLHKNSVMPFAEIDLESVKDQLYTLSICDLPTLFSALKKVKLPEQQCIICLDEKNTYIPCHNEFICLDCLPKIEGNKCSMCSLNVWWLRCLACHKTTSYGFVCKYTYHEKDIHQYIPCQHCNFPMILTISPD